MKLNVLNLGRCEYEKALEIQFEFLKKRQERKMEDTLIIVEHPPVITLGKSAVDSNILISEELLKEKGIDIYKTGRGGDVTYHGNGQIVGYPIFNLSEKKMGVRNFVYNLEQIFIDLLYDNFKIEATKDEEHIGVWVGKHKIVAIGLAVKKGVSMHGFAFNVNTNLEHFNYIVPCGILDRGVTSVEKLIGEKVDMKKTNNLVLDYFCKIFGYDGITKITI